MFLKDANTRTILKKIIAIKSLTLKENDIVNNYRIIIFFSFNIFSQDLLYLGNIKLKLDIFF